MRSLARSRFEEMASDALDTLPAALASKVSNLHITIEDEPDREIEGEDSRILGLYEGIPLTERDGGYFGVLPDRITLFKRNLEREAADIGELAELIRTTIIHEIAHHFGIDDHRLDELGWS